MKHVLISSTKKKEEKHEKLRGQIVQQIKENKVLKNIYFFLYISAINWEISRKTRICVGL